MLQHMKDNCKIHCTIGCWFYILRSGNSFELTRPYVAINIEILEYSCGPMNGKVVKICIICQVR